MKGLVATLGSYVEMVCCESGIIFGGGGHLTPNRLGVRNQFRKNVAQAEGPFFNQCSV